MESGTRGTVWRGAGSALLFVVLQCLATQPAFALFFKTSYVFPELFPKEVQTAFDHAANDLLGEALATSYEGESVDVLVRWRDLGWPGPYATTQLVMVRDLGPEYPQFRKDTYYPSALANHLLGSDNSDRDIVITLNVASLVVDGKAHWYFGTDGKAPDGTIDLVTLVMHELVHGLGLFSTIKGDGSFGIMDPPGPSIFDRFLKGIVFDQAGKPVGVRALTAMASDADRASAVRWPELLWTGASGQHEAGSDILFLYSPREYSDLASVGHLDPSLASLMNPVYRTAYQEVDRVTLGMLADIGWTVREDIPEPASLGLVAIAMMLLGTATGRRVAGAATTHPHTHDTPWRTT